MKHQTGHFDGVRNGSTYYQCWLPEGDPKAIILIVHGLGEHSGRYGNLVDRLVPRGYALYALDHVGHGKSDGPRAHVNRFRDYTSTLALYLEMVRGWQPGKPFVLFGHSVGGLIASTYLLDQQDAFVGAVISAPATKLPSTISPLTLALARILSYLVPRFRLTAVDPAFVSRDPAVVQAYIADPLVFKGKSTARLGAELISAIQRIDTEAETISLPVLIIQGTEDRLVDPAGAQLLYDRISSPDKTLRMYEGLFHEVCNEPECSIVLSDVEQWLETHVDLQSKGG